jgi:beta-galactosidase/beta-glucuronidase
MSFKFPISKMRVHSSAFTRLGHLFTLNRLKVGLKAWLCFTALCTASAQETQIQFLSGHDKDDAVPWEFFCTSGANSGFWTNLPVPSQWDMKGFGTLNYHKDLTNAFDEQGLYARNFTVPAEWSGRRVFLVFDGVMTDTAAKLNGQSVGPLHQGSFYRFKYEVTSLVNFGATNRLEVTVAKHSKNESVNNAERLADYWVFGGIFRPVYLEAVPAQFVERVAINAQADGHFSADVYLNGATNADKVEARIQTLDGKNVGALFTEKITGEKITLNTQAASPKLWTAETPNLYAVEISLKHGREVIHKIHQRFGFRTFEVRDGDGLYLNGQRVILKGADRHSFWPDSGRCLSEAIHRLDIATLKDANMNAVRMSHYPPDERFLDLCDELGIYVLDELAGWHHFYDDTIGPQLVQEMVVRDVNHPSILFWDNGNEGGFNTNLDHIFGDLDPQHRRVLHPWATFSGVNAAHYLDYEQATVACEGAPLFYHSNGRTFADTNDTTKYIYMPTEFQHGLYDGGMGAGMEDYWKLMNASKYLGGGFVWALTDDGVKRPDTGEIDVAGNQAPDGFVGPYREREGSFYTIKDIWSPIQVTLRKAGFNVENDFNFTDTKECKFIWQFRRFAQPQDTNSGFTVVRKGVLSSPRIPPGKKGTLDFQTALNNKVDAYALRVEAPDGRELWTWVWPEPSINRFKSITHEPAPQHATATESDIAIEVKSGDLMLTFSKQNGLLSSVRRGEQTFSLTNGPQFTDGTNALTKITFTDDGPDLVVSEKFSGPLQSVSWRVNGNGWLDCNYSYTATGTNNFLGVTFDYPETNVRHKRWLGDGPYRVWKNRMRGTTLGVWENDYNNTITGYKDWVYPEFKGFFSNVHWLQLDTTEGPITVINNSSVPFMQVLTPQFPPANLVGKAIAPVPNCGLGFMDAISPIGSKFKAPNGMGPQSQLNVATGAYSGSVSFYFGKLPKS